MLKGEEMITVHSRWSLAKRRAFLKLPLPERRRILSRQAEDAAVHYKSEQSVRKRETWQGGDILGY
jgi:predicted nuclease of restriction endonuclease-like (RecB) superfamily